MEKEQTRKLAAIMFTDIQGYTALMQHDESKGVKMRDRHREIFNATTEKFDGSLVIFTRIALAQKNLVAPPVEYHIATYHAEQELPRLQWIIKENKEPLSPNLLLNRNIKDAQFINLSNKPGYQFESNQNYCLHLQLTSEIKLEHWYLYFLFELI